MITAILPYSKTANPRNFPGEYPAEIKKFDDQSKVPDNWTVVSEEELNRRIQTHYGVVAALNESADADAKTAEQVKQTQFKGFIATLKTLREKLTESGKLEPSEQAELSAALIDALIAREQQNS